MANEDTLPPSQEGTTVFKVEGDGPLTLMEATQLMREARADAEKAANEPPKREREPEPEAPPVSEPPTPAGDEDAPVEQPPGEEPQQENAEAELPPIPPPRSWSADDKAKFAELPRDLQETVAARERQRDTEVNRRQQEAAERTRAANAQRERALATQFAYENRLPAELQQISNAFQREFPDIRNWDQLEHLQATNPHRFQRFQLLYNKAQATQGELMAAQQRRQAWNAQRWAQYSQANDQRFAEAVPEMRDEKRAKELQENARETLRAAGFTDQEIMGAWMGRPLYLRDHRAQSLLRDAAVYRQMQSKAKKVQQTPVPQVTRPGAVRSTASVHEANVAKLEKQLQTAKGRRAIELATELTKARRGLAR